MEQTKILIIIPMALFFLISGCNNSSESDVILKRQKTSFAKDYNKTNLLNHFPNKVAKNSQMYVSPPSCPPSYPCSAQFGYIYLICQVDTLNKAVTNNILYKTNYLADRNIIINLSELKKNILPVKKCNQWFINKYPIPYFESFDFGLGEMKEQKIVKGDIYFNYNYIIPHDLMVYVIDAEAGNFWKESCNENRPDSLKEWQNGYSRGIATSEKENMIVYWSMLW